MAAACSPEGRYYAALSADGRLKVWNTETNVLLQEYTPDLHLSSPPICLAWITLNTASPTKKGKKRKSSGSDTEGSKSTFIALGTTSGKILIYSVAQAKVETVLVDSKRQDLLNNNVTSLDWERNYGLFSSTADCLYEWDVAGADVKNKYNISVESKNKGSDNVTAIKIVPHSTATQSRYVVTASCQLRLWSLAPLTVLRTMVGHSGAVSSLSLAHFPQLGKCYVASCTKTERLLSFWDVSITGEDIDKGQVNGDRSASKKQRRKSSGESVVTPAYSFVMEDAARCVDVAARETEGAGRVDVAVATRSGVVHYYGRVLNGSSTKPIKPSVTIHVSTEEPKPLPLQCCRFTPHSEEGDMVVGYEATPGRILYEKVKPDTSQKTQVLIRKVPTLETKAAARGEASGTRPLEAQSVTYAQPGAASRKRTAPGNKVEPPMEARLANLALDTTARSRSAVSENLTKLLVQGLHSQDKSLILAVLQRTDVAAATRTVSALPASYVPALLEQLTEMASRKTSQCKAVCVWLSALIRCHSALLLATLSTGATTDKFSQLLAVLTQRRSHLCQLLNLKGRLELTIAQRTGRSSQDVDTEAIIDYIDTSSEESDMEVLGADSDGSAESAAWEQSEAGSEASKAGSDAESEGSGD